MPPGSTTSVNISRTSPCRSRTSSAVRSEEHTSELQSRQYLVCRLLLEKNHDTAKYIVTSHRQPPLNSLVTEINDVLTQLFDLPYRYAVVLTNGSVLAFFMSLPLLSVTA